jgi:hypothetical protein
MEENKPLTPEAAARRAVPPSYPPEMRERCYQLFKEGKSQREIQAETGVPRVTIQRWSDNDRWKSRKRAELRGKEVRQRRTEGEKPANSELTMGEKQDIYAEGMATQALRLPEIIDGMSDDELIMAADKIKNLDAIARKALHLEEAKPTTVINVSLLSRPIPAQIVDADPPEQPALPERTEPIEAELVPNEQTANI